MLKIQLCITGINYILKYIQIENTAILNGNTILLYFCFIIYFYQIYAASMSLKDFKNITKSYQHKTFKQWFKFYSLNTKSIKDLMQNPVSCNKLYSTL